MRRLNSSASFGSFDYDEQFSVGGASSVFESGNREKINLKWLRPVIEWAAGRRRRPHAAPVNRDGAEGEEAKRAFFDIRPEWTIQCSGSNSCGDSWYVRTYGSACLVCLVNLTQRIRTLLRRPLPPSPV